MFIYRIENPGHAFPFHIEATTGVITVDRELDRETQKNYTVCYYGIVWYYYYLIMF